MKHFFLYDITYEIIRLQHLKDRVDLQSFYIIKILITENKVNYYIHHYKPPQINESICPNLYLYTKFEIHVPAYICCYISNLNRL